MKKVFVCLAFAAVLFSSCGGGDGGNKLEVHVINKSDFALSQVKFLRESIAALVPDGDETINVTINGPEGKAPLRFDFTPKGKTVTVSCRTAEEFTVSEENRNIVIDNATRVEDVDDSANSGTLSQITLIIKQYTVTFDATGGTVSPASQQVPAGGTIPVLPTPAKAGNTFGGWYTKTEGGGTQFTTGTKVEANITVYAKWTAVQYTVNFDATGGTVSPASKQVSAGGTIADLPIPTKAGNTFGGWYTKTEGGGTQFTAGTKVDANITVYAKWTAVSVATGKIQVLNSGNARTVIYNITIYNAGKTTVVQSKSVNLPVNAYEEFTVPPGDYVVEVAYSKTSAPLTTAKFSVAANGMKRVTLSYDRVSYYTLTVS